MNVSSFTMSHDRGASAALNWRVAISLALSMALHTMLFMLFLRPAASTAWAGRFDVVTVYLRDSRRSSTPSTPQIARATSTSVATRRDITETFKPEGRLSITSARALTQKARAEAIPIKPTRTTDMVSAVHSRTADASRLKPSPVNLQANRAPDSSVLYLRELAERLSQVKRYPQLAVALHEEGTVLLSFQIDRDGRLLAWDIASSSGHDDLDSEVGRMVAEAAPFPPFPSSWHKSDGVFRVPIGFYLRR